MIARAYHPDPSPVLRTLIVEQQLESRDDMRLYYTPEQLIIERGRFLNGQFTAVNYECLDFQSSPELRKLHDGFGWLWSEVWALLWRPGVWNPAKPIRVHLAQGDTLWHDDNTAS